MKSMYPSAIIFGPVIGIMNEIMPKPKRFLGNPVRIFSKTKIQAKQWQRVLEKKINT
jgi:hypothetical protein